MKKLISIVTAIFIFTMQACCYENTDAIIRDSQEFVLKNVPSPISASIGGEWAVLGEKLTNRSGCEKWFDSYYDYLCNYLNENEGILSKNKYTEYSRAVIALTAIGKNPQAIGGYDLILPLTDYQKTARQGLNGAIWALIALDCGSYIPEDIILRNKYIEKILSYQLENGGFSLTGELPSGADITAMAIQALSPYKDRTDINSAIKKASESLKNIEAFTDCESAAQALIAMNCINDESAPYFLQKLLSFHNKDGGFFHTLSAVSSDEMSTEQALCALSSMKNKNPYKIIPLKYTVNYDSNSILIKSSAYFFNKTGE